MSSASTIMSQARQFLRSGGTISRPEAESLITMAKADGRVTEAEKGALANVLDDFRQTDAANRTLSKFLLGR